MRKSRVVGVCDHFEVTVLWDYSALLGRDLGWESLSSLADLAIIKKKEQEEQHQFIVESIDKCEECQGNPVSTSSDSLSEVSESESVVRVQTSQVMLTRKQAKAQAGLKRL